jgi:4-hydroxy-2-oxoheptanedioate aldolase
MPCGTPERARELIDMGARFLCHGADILMVKNGLEDIQRRFGPLGFTFDHRL